MLHQAGNDIVVQALRRRFIRADLNAPGAFSQCPMPRRCIRKTPDPLTGIDGKSSLAEALKRWAVFVDIRY